MRPRFLGIVTQHGIFYNSVIFLLLVDYASASKGGGRNDGRPHVHFTERTSNGNSDPCNNQLRKWMRKYTQGNRDINKLSKMDKRKLFYSSAIDLFKKKKSSIFVDASVHRFVCKILSAPRPFTIYSILRKFLRSCSRYPVLYGGMNCSVDNNSSAKKFRTKSLDIVENLKKGIVIQFYRENAEINNGITLKAS